MERTALAQAIRRAAYLTGSFTLRSGQVSSFYWDKYRFESDPHLLQAIAGELEALLPASTFHKLAGLELGGIPLATALALRTGKPCLFVRKAAKDYGTRNLVEGGFEQSQRAVVIEDVITTAGQVVSSVNQMRELGLEVQDVLCVIDRQQGGGERLAAIGCRLHPVFTMEELERLAPHVTDHR
jgi:orotate phosphoribosyltransferase